MKVSQVSEEICWALLKWTVQVPIDKQCENVLQEYLLIRNAQGVLLFHRYRWFMSKATHAISCSITKHACFLCPTDFRWRECDTFLLKLFSSLYFSDGEENLLFHHLSKAMINRAVHIALDVLCHILWLRHTCRQACNHQSNPHHSKMC